MPSPFPGMDPFIEGQVWEDFHVTLIQSIREALVPRVRPRYVVRIEERVYVEHDADTLAEVVRPDLTLLDREDDVAPSEGGAATAVAIKPVVLTVPMPERLKQAYLTVRELDTMEVTAVIEVLSPTNKRPGSDGHREYLGKRETLLKSQTHLVELDLLRGGRRLPTVEPLPPGDYYAFICRGQRRPRAEVYAWSLRHRLPQLPIPLAGDDPDVTLDLQSVFTTVYDRAGYDYSLNYAHPVAPTLSDADAAWVREVLG